MVSIQLTRFSHLLRHHLPPQESIKHVILDCDYQIVRDLIVRHVHDIYMGRRKQSYGLLTKNTLY